MEKKQTSSQDLLDDQVDRLRTNMKSANPLLIAERSGVIFHPSTEEGAELRLSVWGRPVRVSFPELRASFGDTSDLLPSHLQALLLYYFLTCDGTQPTGQWLAFSQLPDGRFYDQAFQGYTGTSLARAFGDDLEAFSAAAEGFGGSREFQLGSAAYRFQALPYVPLLAVFWLGDEDFPSSCQILFDSAVSHHLPTDACAILGSYLTNQLLKIHSL